MMVWLGTVYVHALFPSGVRRLPIALITDDVVEDWIMYPKHRL